VLDTPVIVVIVLQERWEVCVCILKPFISPTSSFACMMFIAVVEIMKQQEKVG